MRRPLAKLRHLAARALGRADPIILMYHRVSDVSVDPWDLAVRPARFAEQMELIRRTRAPVPLDWLVGEIRAGRRPQRAVAVTFDDGYRDVLCEAKPILDRYGIPATVFLTTGAIGSSKGFWWDRLASVVLAVGGTEVPAELRLSFASIATGDLQELHLSLWRTIRLFGPTARDEAVDEVVRALDRRDPAPVSVMTVDDVRALIADGAVTIGAHTVTHPSLPSLPEEAQRTEMRESRRVVEEISGQAVRRFAYPFGDFDAFSERIAREIGFDFAVSTLPGTAVSKRDLFRLPRHAVADWTGERFAVELGRFG